MIDFVFARTKVAFDLALVLFITNQDIGEENLNEWNNDNTGENNNLLQTTMEYVVQRPPRPPACRMRPYLQFVTTDLENKLWIGSDYLTNESFCIPQYNQKWRGAFFSCSGFDATVSKEIALGLTYNTVWNHLLSIHEENPFHILLWSGDQNYNDFVIEDVPFLLNWTHMEWNQKWTLEFTDESKYEVKQYYFNNYAEHWERRPEMK
ncbi:unnamed protein product [Rotaria magnacalcarata]|uniref:PhoD-like phosphatase domain-containing protein n=1 Tax=Rotaria magnacalcarata TaxID=392030 RepID=A0A819ATJ8_9BILA|nr:unnamed protein product [Rotaria magnacalcarata]CAF3799601.1 unnamed protein product [Rotaria magnacalcarata]CAF3852987.1 unnamed protein product [Rotaria magnacalcarata]